MSHISRLPLPSISLVLTTDHTNVPRRPSVVKVAPLPSPPTKTYTAQFDPMKTIHSRDGEPQVFEEERHSQAKCNQSPHVVFVEEVESMDFDLAESTHEDCANDERVGVGKAVKRKMSRAIFSIHKILEEIVAYHGRKEEEKPSVTLLACLSTSRQFRECALRHLCADLPVYLDKPNRLKRLHDCMTPAGFSPYMKSVTIILTSQPLSEPLCLNEDILLPLLDTLLYQLSLRTITIQGCTWLHEVGNLSWTKLPPQTSLVLQSLLQATTVTCLCLRWLRDIPPECLSHRSYELVTFVDAGTSTSGPLTKLDTTSLMLNSARFMNVFLPNLRHIKAVLHDRDHVAWMIIENCRNTLETIQVQEYLSEPTVHVSPSVEFHTFPRLEEFTYSFVGSMSTLEVYPVFFKLFPSTQTSVMPCGLEILNVEIHLIDLGLDNSTVNSWVVQLTAVADNPSWVNLDSNLAQRHHFPALRKVSISLKITRFGECTVDRDALQEEVQGTLLKTFSASIKALIPLEVIVAIDI
ncbi:hypothetical protein D9619_012142 [Psilocybe cf. subviscida]|uniref:Uncharacterized protein n=1 Tax=Psilocybe cf. subviscida TaxID=2480587 RepID=A0A8H5B7K3_9AGAR|nr:hypothetical protein D9619_012142 [Psilocybe cf. subviscida]